MAIATRMRIFVTGASGFVGSAVVAELLRAGHHVVGLARSDASAAAVQTAGAEVQRGDLDDVDGLRRAAAASDAVIHLGFIHDFANYAKSAETDRPAIRAMAEVLAGSKRPLVVTPARSASARRARSAPRISPATRPAGSPSSRSSPAPPACTA
jgi:nucleoside-diphosphate-sugar epimerase